MADRAITHNFNQRFKALEDAVGSLLSHHPNERKAKRKATRREFVFIDPGVRTFLTCYDSNENVVEEGRGTV
ncbi:hypothetical protein V1519DRAFT_475461 [Lipomyces tetrasporus]